MTKSYFDIIGSSQNELSGDQTVHRQYDEGRMFKGKDICGWGNFFCKSRSKELAQKNIFCFAVC